jgi:hypothetical protein
VKEEVTIGAALRSMEVKLLRVECQEAYDRGFQAGIEAAAEKDHLSVLVTRIFEEWLNSAQPEKIARSLGLREHVAESVADAVAEALRGGEMWIKLRDYEDD